jgi:Ulp1 family protease
MFNCFSQNGVRSSSAAPAAPVSPVKQQSGGMASLAQLTGGNSRRRKSKQKSYFRRPPQQQDINGKRRERGPDNLNVLRQQPPIKRRDEGSQKERRVVRRSSNPVNSGSILGCVGSQLFSSAFSSTSSSFTSKPLSSTSSTSFVPHSTTTLVVEKKDVNKLPSRHSSDTSFVDALTSLCAGVNDITLGMESKDIIRKRKESRQRKEQEYATLQFHSSKQHRLHITNKILQNDLNNAQSRKIAADRQLIYLQNIQNQKRIEEKKAVEEHRQKIELLKKQQSEEIRRIQEEEEANDGAGGDGGEKDMDPEHGTMEERLAHRVRPLTSEELSIVEHAIDISRGDSSEVLVKAFKVEMTRKLMSCFHGLGWLNDEAVNFNMEMLNARDQHEYEKRLALYNKKVEKMKPTSSSSKSSSSTSSTWSIEVKHNDGMKNDESSLSSPPKRLVWCCKSFLMTKMDSDGYKGVKRWSKKAKLNSNHSVFELYRLVLPVNISNSHWTSVHINFLTKEIIYYDSMGGSGEKWLRLAHSYLKGEWERKNDTKFDVKNEWSMFSLENNVPQQKNCSDCGMFTCMFATYETDVCVRGRSERGEAIGIPLSFSQRNMPLFRKRLALDILKAKID